jgi:hypothetical protein
LRIRWYGGVGREIALDEITFGKVIQVCSDSLSFANLDGFFEARSIDPTSCCADQLHVSGLADGFEGHSVLDHRASSFDIKLVSRRDADSGEMIVWIAGEDADDGQPLSLSIRRLAAEIRRLRRSGDFAVPARAAPDSTLSFPSVPSSALDTSWAEGYSCQKKDTLPRAS